MSTANVGMWLTSQVHLDTRHRHHDLVLVPACNILATPTEPIIGAELEQIWREVIALNDQILDNGIHHRVGVLDTGKRDVLNIFEDGRNDNVAHVFEQMRLECGLAVLVIPKVIEQFLHCLGKGFVVSVLVELTGDELELVKNVIGMVAITIAKEKLALFIDLVPLFGSRVFQDIALLLEAATDEPVQALPEFLQLRVTICVAIHFIDGVDQVIERSKVGKSLEKRL